MGGDGSKAASSASRNWHGEGAPAVSAARDCSPGATTGRSRGSGTVSAIPTGVAASKAAAIQMVLADIFRRGATIRRACLRHGCLQAHFAISSVLAANSGNRSAVHIRNPIPECRLTDIQLATPVKSSTSAHHRLTEYRCPIRSFLSAR
jgi:hypothetical protein